jgi:hypothetical protein
MRGSLILTIALAFALSGCAHKKPRSIQETVAEIEQADRDYRASLQQPQGGPGAPGAPGTGNETVQDLIKLWMGKDSNGLIERLGLPKREFKMPNGNMMYEFLNEGPPRVVTASSGDVTQSITFAQFCRVTVIVNKKAEVLRGNWFGNSCN